MSTTRSFSGDEIVASGDLPDWVSMHKALQTRFKTGNFATGLALLDKIGAAAEAANHHPDLDLRYTHLNVTLSSHDVDAKTQRDLDLAAQISEFAAELGIVAEPDKVARLELALDTWDRDEIKPFWEAVLGLPGSSGPDDEIRDDAGDLPTIWFQECERHEEPTQRFHLDLRVPPNLAEQRIEDAIAAGGVLVSDDRAPTFTVLADAQGNKVCICTHVGRSD